MKIRYLGHSSFEIILPKPKGEDIRILTDPFYYGRFPGNPRKYDPIKAEDVYDYILITHEHFDHCDSQLIDEIYSDRTKIITTPDAAAKIHHPCITMLENQEYADENISLRAVHAEHGSSAKPIGFMIESPEKIYFAGDTRLYQNIGEIRAPFLAFLPIGGSFTMTVEEASSAASLIRPAHLIPMHYNTWGVIEADTEELKARLKEKTVATKLHVLKPGQEIELTPFTGQEGQTSMLPPS
ncbi:MAG: MBL fold metallo-hydrolase [archaeon]